MYNAIASDTSGESASVMNCIGLLGLGSDKIKVVAAPPSSSFFTDDSLYASAGGSYSRLKSVLQNNRQLPTIFKNTKAF